MIHDETRLSLFEILGLDSAQLQLDRKSMKGCLVTRSDLVEMLVWDHLWSRTACTEALDVAMAGNLNWQSGGTVSLGELIDRLLTRAQKGMRQAHGKP